MIELTGEKFGRLVVLGEIAKENPSDKAREFICLCDCGSLQTVKYSALRQGSTRSCGCLHKEVSGKRFAEQDNTGSGNPRWKGGITSENSLIRSSVEYKRWRLSVFKEDSFTCQKCLNEGGDLQAHHILAFYKYPEARLITGNGITLCEGCHKEFHKEYGLKKFSSEDFWEWLNA